MQANQKYSTSTEAPSLSRVSVKPSSKQVKAEKGRRGHSIFATTYQGSPDGEKECPCQPEGSTHRWPPHEYETDLYAVVRAPSPSHGRPHTPYSINHLPSRYLHPSPTTTSCGCPNGRYGS